MSQFPGSPMDGGGMPGGKPCPTCGQPMKGGGLSMQVDPNSAGPLGRVDPNKAMPPGIGGNQPPPWLQGGQPSTNPGGFVPPSIPKPPSMPQPAPVPSPSVPRPGGTGGAGPYGGVMGGQNARGRFRPSGPGGFGRTPGGAF